MPRGVYKRKKGTRSYTRVVNGVKVRKTKDGHVRVKVLGGASMEKEAKVSGVSFQEQRVSNAYEDGVQQGIRQAETEQAFKSNAARIEMAKAVAQGFNSLAMALDYFNGVVPPSANR